MKMASVKTQNRSGAAVYDTIREMAVEYRFRPAEKINEIELADLLSVSRTPIRDALNRLVTEEFIHFRKNYGFYCRNLDLDEVMALCEALKDLQCVLLGHVANRASAGELEQISNFCQEIAETASTLPMCELARADEAFFVKLSELGGNPVLAKINRNLVARIRFLRKILMENEIELRSHFLNQSRIIQHLQQGNVSDAIDAMSKLLDIDVERSKEALSKGLGRIYLSKVYAAEYLAP